MMAGDPTIERRFAAVARSSTFQNLCAQFHLGEKAVLDIGCSYGEFLAHFGAGSVGVTLVPEEASYARARGLTIAEGNIEDAAGVARIEGTFDVIFANNIFEHLYGPHAFLIAMKKLLRDNGVLILGVPCLPKATALMHFKKFRGALADAHINFFTRDTLALSVERAGWVVEEVRGFRFKSSLLDALFNSVYPHVYVIARVDNAFAYSGKRQRELKGYAP